MYNQRDIVLIPIPFTDLSSNKIYTLSEKIIVKKIDKIYNAIFE